MGIILARVFIFTEHTTDLFTLIQQTGGKNISKAISVIHMTQFPRR